MTLDELRKMRSLPAVGTVADAVDGMDLNAVFDLAEAMLMLREGVLELNEVVISKTNGYYPLAFFVSDGGDEPIADISEAVRTAHAKWKER